MLRTQWFFIALIAAASTLTGCGFVPQKYYPKAKALELKTKVSDSEDVLRVARKMIKDLSQFPPMSRLAADNPILVNIDPLQNNTRYYLDQSNFHDEIKNSLIATGLFEIPGHLPEYVNIQSDYHLQPQLKQKNGEFKFKLILSNNKTGLALWEEERLLKIRN